MTHLGFIITVILGAGILAGIETDKLAVENMGGLFQVLDFTVISFFVLSIDRSYDNSTWPATL